MRRPAGTVPIALAFALPLLLSAAALTSSCGSQRSRDESSSKGKSVYYCPMHPDMKSDKPGNCPICSMKLVPLEPASGSSPADAAKSAAALPPSGSPAGASSPGAAAHGHGGAPPPDASPAGPGSPAVRIAPERQQQIGIRFATARREPASIEIRAVGKVAADERRIAHVHTKVSGWIDEVFVNFVGQPVKRGQPLFTLYSPDLVATQEEYLLARKAGRELGESPVERAAQGSRAIAAAARRRLELWDVTPAQIEALEQRGEVTRTLTIHSPVGGVVTERAAYHHGRTVTPDMDLYTIVDLERVWVLAQVYEADMGYLRVGQAAEIELPYEAEQRVLTGSIAFIPPFVDPGTRTVEVRTEFPNPKLFLKLDAFVNVKLRRDLGRRLVVPKDAVMDSGKARYVFVDKGDGYIEPRVVRAGDEVAQGRIVDEGLREGERVVTAANFILDSESRLRGAFENMGRPAPPEQAAQAAPSVRVQLTTRPRPAKVGKNKLEAQVGDAQGRPIEGATVDVRLFMPQMGNMAPMEAKASLAHTGGGRYEGEIDIPMAWSWETTVTVRKDDKVVGTAMTTITAR
jgi:RND family efflux transporter MFP subunit